MSKWITSDVVDAVSAIPEVAVIHTGYGEDCTTQSLTLSVASSDYNVYVRGFVTDGQRLKSEDNVDVQMVEVTTGFSDGDMPNDPVYVVANAKVKAAVMKLGHQVVGSMDGYF